jgi:hypothetical protein
MSQTEREVEESIDALAHEFDDAEFDDEFDDASDEYELPEILMATEDDEDDVDDPAPSGHLPVGDPLLPHTEAARATAKHDARVTEPARVTATQDARVTEPARVTATQDARVTEPARVTATQDARVTEPARVTATQDPRVTEELRVTDDVLDELRRADVDGPVVQMAPQDDTSTAIRRPRRSADHDPSPFPIPVSVPRMLGRKPRVRRVTRVVRHVDPWSVFKIAFVANILLYITLLIAGVLLWNVAYATGTVDNLERFFESFGWSSFEFDGGEIYHNAWIGGLFLVIGLTGFAVLLAAMFNLITDLVGGVRFTVLEEEVVEVRPSPMRRFVVRRAEPEVPAVTYDASGPIVREAIVDDSGQIGVNAASER